MTASPRANDADRREPSDGASAGDADRRDTPVDHLARAKSADRADPLAGFRDRFVIDDPDLIYLDGNSLGRLPTAARDRLRQAVDVEWGTELIRGWDRWIDLGRETGDLIAEIVGAQPGEIVVSDSTSVNLFKLASAALDARRGRSVIVTDDDNFPTDKYVLQGLAAARGLDLRVISTDIDDGLRLADVAAAIGPDTALVCLSHVAYRSGAVADIAGITAAAQDVGALMMWDLCHSAGSVPVGLTSANVRAARATGCLSVPARRPEPERLVIVLVQRHRGDRQIWRRRVRPQAQQGSTRPPGRRHDGGQLGRRAVQPTFQVGSWHGSSLHWRDGLLHAEQGTGSQVLRTRHSSPSHLAACRRLWQPRHGGGGGAADVSLSRRARFSRLAEPGSDRLPQRRPVRPPSNGRRSAGG